MQILQIGIGPLGQQIARAIRQRRDMRIVAAVDNDLRKTGRDLGELCSEGRWNIPVAASLPEALPGRQADVAVITTRSSLAVVEPLVTAAARAGLAVVSTCEELVYPWRTRPQAARRLDRVCKKHQVACVGTGVNPGFLMDYLPGVLTSLCGQVEKVEVYRLQDAGRRRIPFQQKIGAGLEPAEFQARVKTGNLKHVGLPESAHMLAAALNWTLDHIEDTLEPVLAETDTDSGYRPIRKGQARGVQQILSGYLAGVEKIRLHFRAAVGEPEPCDRIVITGSPSFEAFIPGGINGDVATTAITINAARAIRRAQPGLRTMLDLPVPVWSESAPESRGVQSGRHDSSRRKR